MLEVDSPLRYRVQSFLQYGTGGSFWIIAILTLVFSVSTVAFEQRDKTIWQTMTKPVASWQYVLGKWLGVVGLNAVLLTVCASAVFLFTEYLRQQPARGEQSAFVTSTGALTLEKIPARLAVIGWQLLGTTAPVYIGRLPLRSVWVQFHCRCIKTR